MTDTPKTPEPSFQNQMKVYAQQLAASPLEDNRRLAGYQLQNLINQAAITIVTIEAVKEQGVEISGNLSSLVTLLKMLVSSDSKMGIAVGIGTLDVASHFNELVNGMLPAGAAAPTDYQGKVIKVEPAAAAIDGEPKSTVVDASSRFKARQVREVPTYTDDAPQSA